ncbi:MAG TPA: alpha/beta hydrolase [Bacteroidota bacterium]
MKTVDDISITADVYLSAQGKTAPVILLFHQAGGDARGEYASHIPRLLHEGYNVIATDQRSGGNRFESTNRTVAALEGRQYSYCDAYQDLEAALQYTIDNGFTRKRFVWGSSYTAALVIKLGAEHPKELAGILSFSPASGEAMDDCKPEPFVPKVRLPTLIMRPGSEMTRESSKEQFILFQKHGFQTYVAENGVHGSSMLNPSRVQGDVERHWKVVLDFIRKNL